MLVLKVHVKCPAHAKWVPENNFDIFKFEHCFLTLLTNSGSHSLVGHHDLFLSPGLTTSLPVKLTLQYSTVHTYHAGHAKTLHAHIQISALNYDNFKNTQRELQSDTLLSATAPLPFDKCYLLLPPPGWLVLWLAQIVLLLCPAVTQITDRQLRHFTFVSYSACWR